MNERLSRTILLLGDEAIDRLHNSRVAVFGIGGVGGYIAEALARSGVGHIDIIDNDVICESNINRQIIAFSSTIGRAKVDVMKERINDINPEIEVNSIQCFYLPETRNRFNFSEYSYVADAVDTVTAKLDIIIASKEAGVPVISCMGAGNKLDPSAFLISDISKTTVCPLARVMRHELKKRGIENLKVVYSREAPIKTELKETDKNNVRKVIPGSVAFVPSVAGLIMASEIIKDLTENIK